ncbi:hypothetical protein FD755_011257, partial [Muntiacus reevesi]
LPVESCQTSSTLLLSFSHLPTLEIIKMKYRDATRNWSLSFDQGKVDRLSLHLEFFGLGAISFPWSLSDSFEKLLQRGRGEGQYICDFGFGNISPRTEGGKIFCIIYALLGIPLFGFLLAGVGDQLGTIFGKGIAKVEDTFIKWNVSQTKIRIISTIIFILFGCVLFVALPAVIFKHIEGWSALDAIYFVVITLTTIGFGDYVAETTYLPLIYFFSGTRIKFKLSLLFLLGLSISYLPWCLGSQGASAPLPCPRILSVASCP